MVSSGRPEVPQRPQHLLLAAGRGGARAGATPKEERKESRPPSPPGAPSSRTGPARQEYSAAAPVAPSALCVSSHQALPLLLRRQRALLASICFALPAKEGGSDAGNDRGDATAADAAAGVEGWPGRSQAKHGHPSQSLSPNALRPRVVEPRAPVQGPRHVSPRLCRALNSNVRLERRHPPPRRRRRRARLKYIQAHLSFM